MKRKGTQGQMELSRKTLRRRAESDGLFFRGTGDGQEDRRTGQDRTNRCVRTDGAQMYPVVSINGVKRLRLL